MREDNLLAVQPRAFVITTDSDHNLEVYLNLASRMKLTGVNQLWVADITYIRLHREWVFLALIKVHFYRNVLVHVPKRSQAEVSEAMKAVFLQRDERSAKAKAADVERQFQPRFAKAIGDFRSRNRRCAELPSLPAAG